MSEELELKYRIDDPAAAEAAIDELFPSSATDATGWQTLAIIDRYFDTPDQALARAGYGARLRRIGRTTLLTLKSDISVKGARHLRLELEAPATRSLRRPERWPPSEASGRLLSLSQGKRLIESFTVRQRRRERELLVDGARLVASVDAGTVELAGATVGTLNQLEVELRAGPPSALNVVASMLDAAAVGAPESRSKLVMAAQLAEAAGRVALDEPLAEAGRQVLRRHLLRMLEREIALRAGDPEGLRQMRVATRRMRATWRVFGTPFKRAEERRYIAELRRVAGALGEVRDLDVLLAVLPDEEALAPLAEEWRERHRAARQRLDELLDSADYARFVDDYLQLTGRHGAGIARRRAGTTVRGEVDASIAAGATRLLEASAAAQAAASDEAWHALRIAAKRLRYTIEALRDVLEPAAASAAIEHLRAVQDAIGTMNDAAVAAREAQAWLDAQDETVAADTRAAVGAFVSRERRLVDAARLGFESVWAPLASGDMPAII